jgi:drug/metabolite transporter (DMT)-like permease
MKRNGAYLMLFGSVLFWSGNFVIGRAMAGDIGPIALAFWRWLTALVVFLPFGILALRRDWPLIRSRPGLILLQGTFGVAGFNTLVYLGLQDTSATNALLINSFIPVFIILLTALWLREPVSMRRLLAILVSAAGVVALIAQGDIDNLLALHFNPGDLWILLAAASWAIYSISLRWRPAGLSAAAFLTVTMLIGLSILTPVYWLVGDQSLVWSTANLLTVGYVAVFASISAFLLWNQGVRVIGAASAGQFIHLMPLLGTLMAIVFLGEVLRWHHLLGALAIGLGVYLVVSDPDKRQTKG